jgi:DNA-binding HxlR family transcriptional regulator
MGRMDKTTQPSTGKEETTCESHSSMDRAIRLIGDRWTLFIVYNLLSGPRRFGELLAMGNVSPKTVSQRLKMLEKVGFVERHAFAEIPPRVEYHLTEKGRALVDILGAIRQFGENYLADEVDSITALTPTPLTPPECNAS